MYMGSIRRYTKDDGVSKMSETWQNGKAVGIGSKHPIFGVLTHTCIMRTTILVA
jgi:hypothetical protein